MSVVTVPPARPRKYLPAELALTDWASVEPYFKELQDRLLSTPEDLSRWILDRSELEAVVSEELAWRYIAMTVNTADEQAVRNYQEAVTEISPKLSVAENALNRKLVESPFSDRLDPDRFAIYLREVRKDIELFREENIPLQTDIQLKAQEYGTIFSNMTIRHGEQDLTLQQASTLLEETDRSVRERVYRQINERIGQDADKLEQLFEDLVQLRHQVGRNAGFDNYRDYKFRSLGRFDYTVQDCLDFHEAIEKTILPLEEELNRHARRQLGVDALRPWDLAVDWSGKPPLRPFGKVDELIERSIDCLARLDPSFGESLAILQEMGHLDLDSRPAKSPGGYNMPLHFTGVPFIFMNASQSIRDVQTLMHETGHAVHSLLTREYELNSAKQPTPEIAELASMTMELLTMDYWDSFFDKPEDLRRARFKQLESVIKALPWIAAIDSFQHWIYTHPGEGIVKRREAWWNVYHRFASKEVDRSGLEDYTRALWVKQLHLYEVPFYYIEYGMAQLGAIAIWMRYREEPEAAIADFTAALRLGYTRPIGEIYERAGIQFDFSVEQVRKLGAFIQEELNQLIGS